MSDWQPWGYDAHSALRWSFAQLTRSGVLPTVLDSYLRSNSGPRIGLTRLDIHAQAAQIRDRALGDDPLHRNYLTCVFLPAPSWERLPGGGVGWVDRYAEERCAAVHQVAWWLLGATGSGVKRIRGYQEIVIQYAMGKPNNERLKRALRISSNKVAETRGTAFAKLDGLHELALARADARLRAADLL